MPQIESGSTNDPVSKPAPSSHLSEGEWDSIAAQLHLSPRLLQIVRCIFDGLEERAICDALGIASGTIHSYLDRLFKRLGIHSRSELIVRLFLAYASARNKDRLE